MTIKEVINTLQKIENKTEQDNIVTKVKSCIDTLKRFEEAPQNRDFGAKYIVPNEVEKAVKNMDSNYSPCEIDITWADRLVDVINKMVKPTKGQEPGGQGKKGKKHPILVKFVDFIPVIFGLIISGIALSLGLTIFNDNQDATYFIAETIKDVLGGIASGLCANQVIVFCKKTEKTSHITLVGGLICSICACVFSVVLWILSNYAFVERFTQWDKITYLWICLSLLIISAISIGLIVCFLIGSSIQKKKTESKQ